MSAIGVDGCRGGWVVAATTGVRVWRTFVEVLDERADVVGVDMPVGLPDAFERAADRDARAFLRPRASSIFPTPPRSLLAYDTYDDANTASKAAFGRGLTRQTFSLFEKLREVDSAVRAGEKRVVEIHPECSFRALTGRVLAPKRTIEGLAQRVEALEPVFGPIDVRLRGAQRDDVVDAYAVLWSAVRYERGEHLTFGDGARDAFGTVMRIVA